MERNGEGVMDNNYFGIISGYAFHYIFRKFVKLKGVLVEGRTIINKNPLCDGYSFGEKLQTIDI